MASIIINGEIETGSAEFGTAFDPALPLVVEFDGTCVKTNLLLEFLLALLKQKPQYLFLAPFWLVRGKAYLAQQIARRACVDVGLLPYRTEFLEYLKSRRKCGRSIILATRTDLQVSRQVADYLMLSDASLHREGAVTLLEKAQLRRMVRRLGEGGFDYATSGSPDLTVVSSARKVILVHPSRKARLDIPKLVSVERVFDEQRRRFTDYLTPLRPQHWIKNLLVFVPVLAAHRFYEISLLERSLVAFAGLCCVASAGYLFNDLFDLSADRHHPRKRLRPFAVGDLPLSYGLVVIPCLIGLGCAAGAWLSPLSVVMLLSYFVLAIAYTLYIKRIVLLDVLVLAGLYTLRIIAGSAAVWIWPSPWLLGFSMFLFLSLALVKRYSELVIMRKIDGDTAKARSYELGDAELLAAKGTASGYGAVFVLALYITSGPAAALYGRHQLMWFLCPLLLYWIGRMWLLAHRGKMNDDPVVFAATDPISRILLLLMLGTAVLAL
jgi:4-hydroxybenzoate polyprenyltransferase